MTSTYLSYRLLTNDMSRTLSRIASQADVARDMKYYQDNIGKVTSVDQFLDDRRLFSIALKAAFLVMAVLGVATLWMAVVADMGASLIVIATALRLLRE